MELLREGVAEYALETGGAETTVEHFTEWLAEWGRDVRRQQRGLLLLTAHRAKGLEFDHVVVLDGGWNRVGKGEDRRRAASALLRGHDPGSADPGPDATAGSSSLSGCSGRRSRSAASRGTGW